MKVVTDWIGKNAGWLVTVSVVLASAAFGYGSRTAALEILEERTKSLEVIQKATSDQLVRAVTLIDQIEKRLDRELKVRP